MKMDKVKQQDFELAPLRSLDDFILEAARFQLPNIKDLEKWGNRVVNNLLYYQTNYFLMAISMFTIVGIAQPAKMIAGTCIVLAFGLLYFVLNENSNTSRFKRDHPYVMVAVTLVVAYFAFYMFGSLLVFLFGILLPFCVVFVHASMRLRNIRNKIVNKMEVIGLKKTPMGLFLESMGLEPEIFS